MYLQQRLLTPCCHSLVLSKAHILLLIWSDSSSVHARVHEPHLVCSRANREADIAGTHHAQPANVLCAVSRVLSVARYSACCQTLAYAWRLRAATPVLGCSPQAVSTGSLWYACAAQHRQHACQLPVATHVPQMLRVSCGVRSSDSQVKLCPHRTPLATNSDSMVSLNSAGQAGMLCTSQPRRVGLQARMPLQWPKVTPPRILLPGGGSSL